MEEHRLRMFEKMVLRKMFGSKRDEVKGKWVIISRRTRWTGHVARMGERTSAYKVSERT